MEIALVCPSTGPLFHMVRAIRRVPIFVDLDTAIQSLTLSRSA